MQLKLHDTHTYHCIHPSPEVSCADSAVTLSAMSAQSVRRKTEPNVQMMRLSGT